MRRTRLEIVEETTAASHPHPGSALTLLQGPTEPCFHALPAWSVSTATAERALLDEPEQDRDVGI